MLPSSVLEFIPLPGKTWTEPTTRIAMNSKSETKGTRNLGLCKKEEETHYKPHPTCKSRKSNINGNETKQKRVTGKNK